jgi:outer membrane protein TolC
LGLEDDVTIRPTDALTRQDAPAADALPSVADVNARRSDMRALRARRAAAAAEARARRAAFLPSVGAFGGYMWNDAVPLGTRGESWMVGAKLSWTLFGGFEQVGGAQAAAAARRRADLAVRDQALLNAVDLAAARRDLTAARRRLDRAATAVAQAEESLRIRTDRFGEGLARTADVLQAEATLAQQRLRRLQALYAHTLARYRLELLTETPLGE